jgi:signal transduction histidine kinase
MLGLSFSLMGGAAICFGCGTWLIERFKVVRSHTIYVVLCAWLLTGLQPVLITQLVHRLAGGDQISLKARLIFVPLMWLGSLLSTSHMYQSRYEYVLKFRQLRDTHQALIELEESSQQALHNERQQLIDAVQRTVKPELKLISAEVQTIEMHSHEVQLKRILEKIDNYSLKTLRTLISELDASDQEAELGIQQQVSTANPKLSVRQLPLDAIRSLRVACAVGGMLLLPIVGFHVVVMWFVQVLLIFLPLFVLQAIRLRLAQRSRVPEVTWVVCAAIIVSTRHLWGIHTLPQISAVTINNHLPILSSSLFVFAIFLGAFDRSFIDAYIHAAQEQEEANTQLTHNLSEIDMARQLARKELSRLLHGPIQGRLAAVRIKLHMLTEQTQTTQAVLTQQDIVQLAQMVEQITNDIEAFSVAQTHVAQVDVSQALDELTQNWQGLMNVSFNASPQTTTALKEDPYLARKVISACSEAITNASRHGSSTHIAIDLELTNNPNALLITAGDNGTGVSDVVVPGIGLRDIEADGGQWSFGTVESGTQFIVGFPLQTPALT